MTRTNRSFKHPRLSICIPTYNGLRHIRQLLDSLMRSSCIDFEIVVSDDCSGDGTWDFLQDICWRDNRVRIFRNDINLGMDRNFARSVDLATGEFVWLCGQDDVISPDGVAAVIDLIEGDAILDFIHMPYAMLSEAQHKQDNGMKQEVSGNLHGSGLLDFLVANEQKLPSFLPEFVIRRSLWQQVDVSHYFGTCYCQVGVFLEVSERLRWFRLSECYVTGNLPRDGWQANPLAYARIICGYFVMLDRALGRATALTKLLVYKQYSLHHRQLTYALLLVRAFILENRVDSLGELKTISKRYLRTRSIIATYSCLPSFICKLLLRMIAWTKLLKVQLVDRK